MEVILIDDVYDLGRRGQVVKVSPGYGRNYLIPRKLAVPATAGNLRMVEQQRISQAKKEAKFVEEAQILADQLRLVHLVVSRKAGDTGVLFGSVTAKDVSEVLERHGINLDRRKIVLDQPIKTIGNFTLQVHPHHEVESSILLSVLPEGDDPVAKMLQRGLESDKVVEEVNARVAELQKSS